MRRRSSGVPILVLTADTTAETRNRALSACAKDFLTKPFDRTEVFLRVRSLLETRTLYADLKRHNAALKADLTERMDEERPAAGERRRRRDRIDDALSNERFSMVFQPIADYDALLAALAPLRERGVRIAVDDAGAGYCSLRHVLRLRPDMLKLDIGLTGGIHADPARRALSTALLAFAREIGAMIVAEGIETGAELETLRRLDVPWGQGHHLARPAALPVPTHLDALLATV